MSKDQKLDEVLEDLRCATDGLMYPSETDAPVEVEVFEAPYPWEQTGGTPVEEQDAGAFFEALSETDDAARFHALYGLLAGHLQDLRAYRVGEVRVAVFVAGREPESGKVVGVRTLSVET